MQTEPLESWTSPSPLYDKIQSCGSRVISIPSPDPASICAWRCLQWRLHDPVRQLVVHLRSIGRRNSQEQMSSLQPVLRASAALLGQGRVCHIPPGAGHLIVGVGDSKHRKRPEESTKPGVRCSCGALHASCRSGPNAESFRHR